MHLKPRPTFLYDFNQIEQWIYSLKPDLEKENIGLIIGILRGGAYPALMISHMTDIPVTFLKFDRKTNQANWDNPAADSLLRNTIKEGKQVLLCEDIAGSGFTLLNSYNFIKEYSIDPIILTLVHDEKSRMVPKYSKYIPEVRWLLPWERHTVNNDYQQRWENALDQHVIKDADYHYVGLDLDGIFCEDVPDYLYNYNLEQALLLRGNLLPFNNYPEYNPEKSIIVTARPNVDYTVTHEWLVKHEIPFKKLILRDTDKYPYTSNNVYNSARFKADICLEQYLLEFYESDPQQAILMAAMVPHVKIIQWNHNTGTGYIINSRLVSNKII